MQSQRSTLVREMHYTTSDYIIIMFCRMINKNFVKAHAHRNRCVSLCENKQILEPQVRPHTSQWTEEVDVLAWPVFYAGNLTSLKDFRI